MDDEEAGSVGLVAEGVGSVATAAGEGAQGGAGEGAAIGGVSLFGSGAERVAENRAADVVMAEEGGTAGGTGVRGIPCGAPRGAGGAGTGKTTLTPRGVGSVRRLGPPVHFLDINVALVDGGDCRESVQIPVICTRRWMEGRHAGEMTLYIMIFSGSRRKKAGPAYGF